MVIEKADAQRAVTAFDNIKSAIEAKGVTVGGAAVEDYGMKITDISAGSEEAEAIPFTVTLWHVKNSGLQKFISRRKKKYAKACEKRQREK